MFDIEKAHISKIISAAFIEATRHPESKTVFADKIPVTRCEMIYKISGEHYTHFNGKILHITSGCVYFLPKSDSAYYFVERVTHGDCIDIFFDTDIPLFNEAFAVNVTSNKKFFPLFERFLNTWISKKDGYYYKCMGIFYEILSELQKVSSGYLPETKYKLIEPGVDYIHAHFLDKEIKYTALSDLCDISYSYFKRLFITRFGLSPVQHVTKLKTDRAKELLSTGLYSISDISQLCGYDNVYYFSRVFKEETGLSPSEYKKLCL